MSQPCQLLSIPGCGSVAGMLSHYVGLSLENYLLVNFFSLNVTQDAQAGLKYPRLRTVNNPSVFAHLEHRDTLLHQT